MGSPSLAHHRDRGDGSATASLPSLCQGRGNNNLIAKLQRCKKYRHHGLSCFSQKRNGKQMEHNPNLVFSLSLPRFG